MKKKGCYLVGRATVMIQNYVANYAEIGRNKIPVLVCTDNDVENVNGVESEIYFIKDLTIGNTDYNIYDIYFGYYMSIPKTDNDIVDIITIDCLFRLNTHKHDTFTRKMGSLLLFTIPDDNIDTFGSDNIKVLNAEYKLLSSSDIEASFFTAGKRLVKGKEEIMIDYDNEDMFSIYLHACDSPDSVKGTFHVSMYPAKITLNSERTFYTISATIPFEEIRMMNTLRGLYNKIRFECILKFKYDHGKIALTKKDFSIDSLDTCINTNRILNMKLLGYQTRRCKEEFEKFILEDHSEENEENKEEVENEN